MLAVHLRRPSGSVRGGWIGLEYVRELGVLSALILTIIVPASWWTQPAPQDKSAAVLKESRPVYALGFSGLDQQLWVSQLYSGAKDYEWKTGEILAEWPLQLKTLCDIDRGGTDFVTTVAAQSSGRTLIIHNEKIYVNFLGGTGTGSLVDVDVSHDGKTVVGAHRDGRIRIWTWNGDGYDAEVLNVGDIVDGLRISPDCRQLLVILEGCRVAVWDRETGTMQKPFKAHDRRTSLVVWSPENARFATGGEDGMIRVWQTATGTMEWEARADSFTPSSMAWSPNGAEIAVGGFDKLIRTFEAKSGQLTTTLAGHQGAVRAIAYEPQGTAIVSGDLNGEMLVWSVPSKTILRRL